MAVEFNNFDPGAVIVSFAGIALYGFAPGTLVSVARNTDTFSLQVGPKGDGTRVRSRDASAKVSAFLMGGSTCNDLLSARAQLDELTGLGYGALLIKYVNGTTICSAANAWLVRPSDLSYDDDPTPREWMIEAHDMKMSIGGSVI